jgi:hypothetical protein
MGEYQMSQILVLIYQGLIKNHSFIIRRSWDWIHTHQFCFVFSLFVCVFFVLFLFWYLFKALIGNQIRLMCMYSIPTPSNDKTFRDIVNEGKNYCDFFPVSLFYRRNTYLRYYIEHRHFININSIQFGLLFSWTDIVIQLRCCWTQA